MTSTPSLNDLLTDVLTTHVHNDVVGTMTLNVADGLFAIANAINRLADVEERKANRQAKSTDAFNAAVLDSIRADGHA